MTDVSATSGLVPPETSRATGPRSGQREIRAALGEDRGLFWSVGLFSVFVNALVLTGPLYMIQVYDRVLSSRSIETLVALSLLVLFLYVIMGVLDFVRSRVMARIGARFQTRLEARVLDASLQYVASENGAPVSGMRDLEQVQRTFSAPITLSLFDMPWAPLFLFGIWLFHPWLGLLAMAGGVTLIVLAWLSQALSREHVLDANAANLRANTILARLEAEADMVSALGMRGNAVARWLVLRNVAFARQMASADLPGLFVSITKALRLILQSAMLGLGALLVIRGELTAGAMIAGSILLGRALMPIEQVAGGWASLQYACKSWSRLSDLLDQIPPEPRRTRLPRPEARLELENVSLMPDGADLPLLRGVSFKVEPGQAVGVIGPSGAGKSTLARVVTGALSPTMGEVRFDGAALGQYAPDELSLYIGYLPQRVRLFDGTIADNIAGLMRDPDDALVVDAAQLADAHGMILQRSGGYETIIRGNGDELSGGQVQRVGLARALFGDPVLVVLDEPNSNLDNAGSDAVNAAIRALKSSGKSVLVIAHRPAAIKECDRLLMLDAGKVRAFGPKNAVLREVLQNSAEVVGNQGSGGVQ